MASSTKPLTVDVVLRYTDALLSFSGCISPETWGSWKAWNVGNRAKVRGVTADGPRPPADLLYLRPTDKIGPGSVRLDVDWLFSVSDGTGSCALVRNRLICRRRETLLLTAAVWA